jgi:hypothetical protein
MSELSKAEIARINGAKSHGPVSPRGKAHSSMNALKHGLTAKTVVLCNESKQGFNEMSQAVCDQWLPQNEVEAELVEIMIVAKWRQRRYWGVETATVDLEIDTQATAFARKYDNADELTRMAEAFHGLHAKDNTMPLLNRYEMSMDRQYFRAQNQLLKIRDKKVFPPAVLRNEPTQAVETTEELVISPSSDPAQS